MIDWVLAFRIASMPRPKKPVDLEQLKKLLALQCTKAECAAFFEVTKPTLEARIREAGYEGFQAFADVYRQAGKISLRRHQWRSAEAGHVGMQIWLGKQWLGQAEKVENKTEFNAAIQDALPEKQAQAVRDWASKLREKAAASKDT